MRPPPSLARFPAFPVVTMISLAAIFVTGAISFGKTDLDPFVMSSLTFEGEPWRLVSSTLPHSGLVHLLFNVYWLWILGTRIEEELGHVSMIVIVLVLAVGSTAAQFVFSVGGIGLSGVGYGIVGFLAAARRRDQRFRDAIDARTLQLFIAWGVLCIVLTMTNVMAIGNFAHAAGFLIGIPLAYAFLPGSTARRASAAFAALALVAAFLAGAWLWRLQLNLSSHAGDDDRYIGTREIDDKNFEAAVRHLERAVALSPNDSNAWYNYGVALQDAPSHIGMTPLAAWRKALALAPKEDLYQSAVARALSREAASAHEEGDTANAEKLYRESISTKETAPALWNLGLLLEEQDKHAEANELMERARSLDPDLAKTLPKAEQQDEPPQGSAGSAL